MEKTYAVQKSALYEDVFADVIETLAELAQRGEIPVWESYSIDKIERVPPIKDYHISLHAGPVETPGRVVATAYIHTVADEDTAEVTVNWGAGHKAGKYKFETVILLIKVNGGVK